MRGKGIKAWPPIVGVLAIAIGLVGVGVQWAPAGDDDAASASRVVSTDVVISNVGKPAGELTDAATSKPAGPASNGVSSRGPVRVEMDKLRVSPTDPGTWPADMPTGMSQSNEIKMHTALGTSDADSAGPGSVLADGGGGRSGDACTCDNDCGSDNVAFRGICAFDKTSNQFECLELPMAKSTPCENDADPCTLEVANGSTNVDACNPARCGGGTRDCTPCPKECSGGQDQESPCTEDSDCLGGTCEEKSGLAAATCSINPSDATRFVCATAATPVGRCCDPAGALTPSFSDEATCLADGTRGLWRRISDPDDLNDPLCPKFSAGIAPADDKTTDAARDLFVIHQTALGCTLVGVPANEDSAECIDATLDCVGLCKDASSARFGLNCKSDADCPDDAGCPGGVCTCGTVGNGDVECSVFATKCPIEGEAGTPDTFTMVCDDYTIDPTNGTNFLQLREFRYRGGSETPGDRVTFEFRDLNDVVYAAFVTAPIDSGIRTRTLQLDCTGNCQPGQNAAEPVVHIPSTGKACMRSSTNQTFRTSYHWILAETAGVDVGTSDPNVMWVDRNDGAGLVMANPYAGASNLIFEFDGFKVADSEVLWACCDGAPCVDESLPNCTFCDGGPFDGLHCDFNRDCGSNVNQELLVCGLGDLWKGPQSALEVALGIGSKCVDGVCDVGACCDAGTGGCTVTASGACGGVYQGDGTECEPNCCTQPALTAGDCCEDTLYCPNGNDPNVATTECAGGAVGDPCDASSGAAQLFCDDGGGGDLGACAVGAVVGDACSGIGIGASFTGTCQVATCKLCAGPALIHTFTVPPPFSENRCSTGGAFCDVFSLICDDDGSITDCAAQTAGDPCLDATGTCISNDCTTGGQGTCDPFNPTEIRLISGNAPNPSAGPTVNGAEGDLCGQVIGSDEGGHFEVFDIDSPARVTVSWCCNNPPESPVFFVLFQGCSCDLIFRDPGSFSFGVGGGAAAFCPDGGASFDVSLDTGKYALIKSTGATCQNSTASCSENADCAPGVLCENTNFGPYNVQLHVSPLQTAACCLVASCSVVNLFDCNTLGGTWLGPGLRGVTGSGVTTIPPVFDCAGSPCAAGSCCSGPGACSSNGVLGDITPAACALQNPNPAAYIGGVNCLEKPCPACTLDVSTQCQPLLSINSLMPSSSRLQIFHADDMNPTGTSLSELCFDWVWNLGGGCGGNEPDDKFDIKVYDCTGPGGIPGAVLGDFQDNLTASAAENPTFGSALQTYGMVLSPAVDVTGLSCVWIEIVADDSAGCTGGWMIPASPASRILIGNNYGITRFPDRPYHPLDIIGNEFDVVLCIGPTAANLGTGTGFDGGSGDTTGAACCDGVTLVCDSTKDAFGCSEAAGIFLIDQLCTDVPSPCARPANDDCATLTAAFDIPNCVEASGDINTADDIGSCSNNPNELCQPSLVGAPDCEANDVAAGSATCVPAPTTENYICNTVAGTNLFATTDGPSGVPEVTVPPDDECGGLTAGSLQADVWHRVTAPCSGTMNVNMCGFGPVTDHVVEVFNVGTGCPVGNGVDGAGLVGCNDDGCNGLVGGIGGDLGSTVFAGVEYLIRVTGLDGIGPGDPGEAKTASQGPYELDVRFQCSAFAPPAPPTLAAAPHEKPKVKYISIDASVNGAQPLAIKITETTTGKVMWASTPTAGSNISNISVLSATPVEADWSASSVLHLTGCIIQPLGVYEITFVSDPNGANVSSMVLPASATCAWGDVQANPGPCDAGIGDIVESININTFSPAIFSAPHGDVQGDVMNGELGIGDIVATINGATAAAGITPIGYTELSMCP